MAKALIKADVRTRASFFGVLRSQHEKRRSYGELSFSLSCDDHKRNICYVILEWESFKSLNHFLNSSASKDILDEWPAEEILEVLRLREIGDEFEA
jgi:quinol monooxygenase YgiN